MSTTSDGKSGGGSSKYCSLCTTIKPALKPLCQGLEECRSCSDEMSVEDASGWTIGPRIGASPLGCLSPASFLAASLSLEPFPPLSRLLLLEPSSLEPLLPASLSLEPFTSLSLPLPPPKTGLAGKPLSRLISSCELWRSSLSSATSANNASMTWDSKRLGASSETVSSAFSMSVISITSAL